MGTFTGTKAREDEEADKIRLYDFATGELRALLKGHTSAILALAFSPDSRRLISGAGDKTAIIWDVATHQPLHPPLRGHTDYIYGVGFSPDGARAVTASFDETLRLWNVADDTLVQAMPGHGDKTGTPWKQTQIGPPDERRLCASNRQVTVLQDAL